MQSAIFLIVVAVLLVSIRWIIDYWMKRRIRTLRVLTEYIDGRMVEMHDETIKTLAEKIAYTSFTNNAEIIQLRKILLEKNDRNIDRNDEKFKETNDLIEHCIMTITKKIDDLRGELQVLRGRRTGDPREASEVSKRS